MRSCSGLLGPRGPAARGEQQAAARGDVVLVLSNSGETPEIADIVAHTRRFEIPLIGVAGREGSTLLRQADVALLLPQAAEACGTGIVPTIVVISLLSWPVLSRMVRARLLELRERDFVVASRGMGASMWHLLFRHGLPNCIDIIVVYATLQIANAILLEAGLSFLGLGIAPPQASWGNMLNAARSTVVMEQYIWQWMFPGGALVLTVLAINFLGDGLRDAFDPRSDLN